MPAAHALHDRGRGAYRLVNAGDFMLLALLIPSALMRWLDLCTLPLEFGLEASARGVNMQ